MIFSSFKLCFMICNGLLLLLLLCCLWVYHFAVWYTRYEPQRLNEPISIRLMKTYKLKSIWCQSMKNKKTIRIFGMFFFVHWDIWSTNLVSMNGERFVVVGAAVIWETSFFSVHSRNANSRWSIFEQSSGKFHSIWRSRMVYYSACNCFHELVCEWERERESIIRSFCNVYNNKPLTMPYYFFFNHFILFMTYFSQYHRAFLLN